MVDASLSSSRGCDHLNTADGLVTGMYYFGGDDIASNEDWFPVRKRR